MQIIANADNFLDIFVTTCLDVFVSPSTHGWLQACFIALSVLYCKDVAIVHYAGIDKSHHEGDGHGCRYVSRED